MPLSAFMAVALLTSVLDNHQPLPNTVECPPGHPFVGAGYHQKAGFTVYRETTSVLVCWP